MELGLKKRDEDEQRKRKEIYDSTEKWQKTKWNQAVFLGIIWLIVTVVTGIQSIFDRSKLPLFIDLVLMFIFVFILCWVCVRFFGWFMMRINKRMYIRDIPEESKRTLKNVLNLMRPDYGCILWYSTWVCVVVSAFFATWDILFSEPSVYFISALSYVVKWGITILVGHFFFKWIHRRKDCTQKMLKWTRRYYNYGDEKQGELFKEYVEWSLKKSMLLNCQSIVLTNEFLLGSADSYTFFYPVAIPRDFIKEAELRMVYSHERSKSTTVNICEVVLVCRLNNEKIVNFYLARNQGVEMVVACLQKSGFKFTTRTDMVEYR